MGLKSKCTTQDMYYHCLEERIIQNQHQIGDNTELSEAITEHSKILHSVTHIIVATLVTLLLPTNSMVTGF